MYGTSLVFPKPSGVPSDRQNRLPFDAVSIGTGAVLCLLEAGKVSFGEELAYSKTRENVNATLSREN